MLSSPLKPIITRRFIQQSTRSIKNFNRISSIHTTAKMSSAPGEQFEVRQTLTTEDMTPDPSKSIKLSPARQALVDDIIALYSCEPTIKRVERYTRDCVYDDQFVYANDRYKMAGQWFALPKLFNGSKNERYEVIKNDRDLIQFKNEQVGLITSTFYLQPLTLRLIVMDFQAHSQDRNNQRTCLALPRSRYRRLGFHPS